ncbi:UNVERIFIED_CONTAM: hypothetical protein Sradi_6574000 [Sesamum radiatum]|uniref:Uncharacterized protein n=1 Tax=Sesamum radiatum TaxID=300843 RepID=A0AAW2JXM7_SESRA
MEKVNISLSAVQARLRNVVEERDQFFEANDQIVAHLKNKVNYRSSELLHHFLVASLTCLYNFVEDELAKSITSCRAEADVLSTWINFLEDTWSLQCSYLETKEKEVNAELERHEGYFTKLVGQLLSSYEKELRPSIDRIGKYVENLKSLNEGLAMTFKVEADVSEMLNPRRNLEEEYLDYEAKHSRQHEGAILCPTRENLQVRLCMFIFKENLKVKELFDNIEKLREEFESIERPTLEMENPTKETDESSGEKPQESVANSFTEQAAKELNAGKVNNDPQPPPLKSEQALDPEAELAKLESEFGKVTRITLQKKLANGNLMSLRES